MKEKEIQDLIDMAKNEGANIALLLKDAYVRGFKEGHEKAGRDMRDFLNGDY